ncbi:NACHT domain-containing protein [Streptomyces sp. NPDC005898]|uniref:NACHT domain-containing protein n=1 Tax=Streptomyces sp. NPDC005898 TaxID=3157082 RepID=UPI00340D7C27
MRRSQRVVLTLLTVASGAGIASFLWSYRAKQQGLEDGDVTGRLGVALALVALAWGFWSQFDGRREGEREQPLSASVDLVARRMRQHWEAAEDLHRLNDGHALSVAWRSDTSGLSLDLAAVREVAATWESAAEQPPDAAAPPTGGDELAGEGADLAQILRDRVPTGRLVILGRAGSGKTVLVERLLHGMLGQRSAGGPVHVRIPLGSWPLEGPDLDAWMASYLIRIEPSLRSFAPRNHGRRVRRADALLDEGLIVPVLDGFDELPLGARRHVLRKISAALRAKRPLVLVSRPDEYREAVEVPDGTGRRLLPGAAGIELLPVPADQAAKYLRQKEGDWDELQENLSTDSPVGAALSSPLTLFLCRTAYERAALRPGASPGELLDTARFRNELALRTHLFEAFLPAVYRESRAEQQPPWSAERADRALRHLARHRRATASVVGSRTDLSWWQLHHLGPRIRRRLAWAISLMVAVLWLLSGVKNPDVLPSALFASLVLFGFGHAVLRHPTAGRGPAAGLGWHWRWIPIPAGFGALMGAAMAHAHVEAGALPEEPVSYVVFAALFACLGAVICGWRPRKADRDRPVTPLSLLRQDCRTFLACQLTWTLIITLTFSSILAPSVWSSLPRLDQTGIGYGELLLTVAQVFSLLAGFGMAVGFIAAYCQTACGHFALACLGHGLTGRTPLRLLAFLDDAHHRGVLRQVGGTYEFRHVELRRHLAAED